MIDTSNLTVPATHGHVKAHRLSLRSKLKMADARKACESAVNMAGGERHYDQPIVPVPDAEQRHEVSAMLLELNKVQTKFDAPKGVYPLSQDLLNDLAVCPKPKKKSKTRVMKEPAKVGKAQQLTQHPQAAGAKGARPRQGSKEDPIVSLPALGKDYRKVAVPEKVLAKEEAKFRAAMDAWKAKQH